jgi:hypothetical protein
MYHEKAIYIIIWNYIERIVIGNITMYYYTVIPQRFTEKYVQVWSWNYMIKLKYKIKTIFATDIWSYFRKYMKQNKET